MASVGSAVLSVTNIGGGTGALRCAIAWTADGSGNVSGNLLALPPGLIMLVNFVPGTAANLYDVDLLNAGGASCFDDGTGASIGANLANTSTVRRVPFINGTTGATNTYARSWLAGSHGVGSYQLTVSGAGAGASGTVIIYLTPSGV